MERQPIEKSIIRTGPAPLREKIRQALLSNGVVDDAGMSPIALEQLVGQILTIPELALPLDYTASMARGWEYQDWSLAAFCARRALEGNSEPFAWS